MLVRKVMIHAMPVMRASLRGGISVSRAETDDRCGEITDIPTPPRAQERSTSGAEGRRRSESLNITAPPVSRARRADHDVRNQRVPLLDREGQKGAMSTS